MLHEGHVEAVRPLEMARWVGSQTAADLRWLGEQGAPLGERARWAARATVHHGGRRVFSALGSRAEQIRRRCGAKLLSLEQGVTTTPRRWSCRRSPTRRPPLPAVQHVEAMRVHDDYADAARVLRDGAVPLLDPVPGMARPRAAADR